MSTPLPEPSLQLLGAALVVSMSIRNAMEDFHCDHLSDEQMAELNPIIRNAVLTALYSLQSEDPRCVLYRNFQDRLIPDYWELPELLPELTELRLPSGA
jgi:hypothetical protein